MRIHRAFNVRAQRNRIQFLPLFFQQSIIIFFFYCFLKLPYDLDFCTIIGRATGAYHFVCVQNNNVYLSVCLLRTRCVQKRTNTLHERNGKEHKKKRKRNKKASNQMHFEMNY